MRYFRCSSLGFSLETILPRETQRLLSETQTLLRTPNPSASLTRSTLHARIREAIQRYLPARAGSLDARMSVDLLNSLHYQLNALED